jgi:TetR/AcrR family transcriptional regulator, transcriptional repressor for nem operon
MSKAENTRKYIVEKTAAVFNKKGFAGTSLTDLTEATGLSKGSIYGNFENKDEVALAVYDYNVSRLTNGLNGAAAGASGTIDKLLKMAAFYRLEFKNSFARGGCPILNTAVEADDTHPALKEKVSKTIKVWKKNIEAVVRQGVEAKEIKPSVDPAKFATEFMALIEGGTMLAKATGDSSLLFTCIDRIEKMINTELKK